MDARFLRYYNQELQHLREMGGEFAQEFPKIAGRLGLDAFECADPYVERLLEGFAFLAARVQLKIDAAFPAFTQHLLEVVYPHYLAPTPSMAVVQVQPEAIEGVLEGGYRLPRGTALRSAAGADNQTPCEYRTAHDVVLWPVALAEAEYLPSVGAVAAIGIPDRKGVGAAIRLKLRANPGLTFDKLALDRLPLYLRGSGGLHLRLYEQLLGNAVGVVARPGRRPAPWQVVLEPGSLQRLGFADEEALLPYGARSFHGYRLLHEYFAFPDRFTFVELTGLGPAVRRCADSELELVVLLDRADPALQNTLGPVNFNPFCTPAINLFPKRADRIHLTEQQAEHHVVPDRTRPMDYEVYQVTGVTGLGASADVRQEFLPFYQMSDFTAAREHGAYYAVHRRPRVLSARQRLQGPRSSYVGAEVYVSLVDPDQAPYRHDLRQLAVSTLCTNRDLPLHMPVGKGATDFTLEASAPVKAVRCLAGPTRPSPSVAHGDIAWRLVSHLSLNYLSLLDSDPQQGAAALRDILTLYGNLNDASVRKQIEGVRQVASEPVIRRLPIPGPTAVGRGLRVAVTLDEGAFEGAGAFLLGAVLEQFFAKYVSINSFTETVVRTLDRGDIMRWPTRIGLRHTL